MPEENALLYRLTNSDPEGRYRLVKEIIVEPHSSVLLLRTRVEIFDNALRGKLRLYALLAPHLKGTGNGNVTFTPEPGTAFYEELPLKLRLLLHGGLHKPATMPARESPSLRRTTRQSRGR